MMITTDTRALPGIPPFRQTSEEKRRSMQERKKKRDPKVRFSLPTNVLLEEQGPVSNFSSTPSAESYSHNFSSTPATPIQLSHDGTHKHNRNASTMSLPLFKRKSKRSNSMFAFPTPSLMSSSPTKATTQTTFVTPHDTDRFKIPVPLVIMSPPKLSHVSAKGDELLGKEMVFKGNDYEIIEILDDDDDIDNIEIQIVENSQSNRGSPLKQKPINRVESTESAKKKNPKLNKALSFNRLKSIAPVVAPKTKKQQPPLKSVLKKQKPFLDTHPQYQESNQSGTSASPAQARQPSYMQEYPQYHDPHFTQQLPQTFDFSNTDDPFIDFDSSFHYDKQQYFEKDPMAFDNRWTFQVHPESNSNQTGYEEPYSHKGQTVDEDYITTMPVQNVSTREAVASQSPRKHNHTRSKSQCNVLEGLFNDLDINDGTTRKVHVPVEQTTARTSPRKHGHSRSKSQINILTEFDVHKQGHQGDKMEANVIYSQTEPVKEIVIPELSTKPSHPLEAEKNYAKFNAYLNDQLERNNIREKAPSMERPAYSSKPATKKRVISPINSHSSYESALSLGRTNSTMGTSVQDEEDVLIDLTNEDQEVIVFKNKHNGSIRSSRSTGPKNSIQAQKTDSDKALALIEEYADSFKVHDSLNKKSSLLSQNDDLERFYSIYRNGGSKRWINANVTNPTSKNGVQIDNRRMTSIDSSYSFRAGDENHLNVKFHNDKGISSLQDVFEEAAIQHQAYQQPPPQPSRQRLQHAARRRNEIEQKYYSNHSITSGGSVTRSETSTTMSTTNILSPLDNLANRPLHTRTIREQRRQAHNVKKF